MTIPFEQLSEEIANVLMAANYKVEMYDDKNMRVYEKQAARKFFTHPDNHMIAIHSDPKTEKTTLDVSLSSPVDVKEFQERVGGKLQDIATRTGDNMSYDIRAYGKELTLKDFAYMKEEVEMTDNRMDEARHGMTGTSRSSYQKVGECRLIVRHSGRVNEQKFGSRSRNIASIYVETKAGERFRMVENSLHGARAMARHLSNGGNPYDVVGSKISGMMGEMAQLRDMIKEVRAIKKSDILSEQGSTLAEQIRGKYVGLRETLRKMSGKLGYFTQSAGLEENERVDELEDKPWGKGISIRKQLGQQPIDPMVPDAVKGAQAITPPTTGSKFTGADKERELKVAVATYIRRNSGQQVDPVAPEHAAIINSNKNTREFLNSPEYKAHMAKMSENVAEDDFDVMLGELYNDDMDAESGTEKGPIDLEAVRGLPPMKQLSLLMAEILSPDPHGNLEIDSLKKEVETLLRTDDEAFNNWSRANDNMTHGDMLQSDGEKQAVQHAAHLLSNAGIGDFNRIAASIKVAAGADVHTPWGEKSGDSPFDEAKQVGGKWGNERASDIEDRIHNRMAKKDIQAGSKRKEREPDKYDVMAKKYKVKDESVREDDDGDYDDKPPPTCKKCGEEHYGTCPLYDNIKEAEDVGKITSKEQKHEYVSNVSEFDRPTGGKNNQGTHSVSSDLVRDNSENMHSENDVEVVKGKLPEHAVLESWFDDMVRVEFFNEQELKDKDGNDITETKLIVLPEDAVSNLNISLNTGYDDFGKLLKTYESLGILEEVVALVEEDSKLWKAIDEGRTNAMWMDQQEQKMDLAFEELKHIVQRRAQSLDSAIRELAQGFDDPDAAMDELYIRAGEAGLDKSDFGSTFADDVLSPNEEIARGKAENKAEEFYGRAKFGENIDHDRIQELAGIDTDKKEDITEGADCGCGEGCKCGGKCDGKCGDENCPCECGERTGKGVNECSLSKTTMEEIEPDLEEHVTDQNLARIIQLSRYQPGG